MPSGGVRSLIHYYKQSPSNFTRSLKHPLPTFPPPTDHDHLPRFDARRGFSESPTVTQKRQRGKHTHALAHVHTSCAPNRRYIFFNLTKHTLELDTTCPPTRARGLLHEIRAHINVNGVGNAEAHGRRGIVPRAGAASPARRVEGSRSIGSNSSGSGSSGGGGMVFISLEFRVVGHGIRDRPRVFRSAQKACHGLSLDTGCTDVDGDSPKCYTISGGGGLCIAF